MDILVVTAHLKKYFFLIISPMIHPLEWTLLLNLK